MNKDLTFLAEDGKLSMSSAAHIRDLAALKAQNIKSKLDNISFINEYISVIGGEKNLTSKGFLTNQLTEVEKDLQTLADLYSLEAWFNEAITAKKALYIEIKNKTLEEWAKEQNITLPVKPIKEQIMDEDDYLATLSIKDRFEYYYIQI